MKPRELFKIYSEKKEWECVTKSHENLFVMGAESVMLRAGNLLHEFFNSESDANKYLDTTQQENLENEFNEWVLNLIR